MPSFDTAEIRQFLTEAFSDEELSTLCFDYFRDVYDDFAAGMTKGSKIQLLLERCIRQEATYKLLAAMQRARPERFERQSPQGVQAPQPADRAQPRERDPRQVFVCHAHEDAAFAHRLAGDLQKAGWRVFIAPDSIHLGEKWADAINRGLDESGVFVVALTPVAVGSNWVVTETSAAIELEHRGLVRFIPVEVTKCEAPPLWSTYQFVPFQDDYQAGLAALLAELGHEPPAPGRGGPARGPTGLRRRIAAIRRNRGRAAIVLVAAVLLLSLGGFAAGRAMQGANKAAVCPPKIGQQVHISKGINAWSGPTVSSGGIRRTFNQRTAVYVVGDKQWGVITYGTDLSGWWWQVSETANGASLGWVWEGQIDECR